MAKQRQNIANKTTEPRINEEIYGLREARVIYKGRDGNEPFNEVMPLDKARRVAASMGFDLIEVNTKAVPPILMIDNYSKYRFEQKKKIKENKRPTQQVKEIQITTNISEHDMEIKSKMAERFIAGGDKVKVVQKMRGRELGRRELSKKSILTFISMLEDVAVPESMPKDEGNKCVVILKRKS